MSLPDTLRFLGQALRAAPRHPALAWRAIGWYARGKRQRARNLLAGENPADRAPARRADRFLAAAPLTAIAPIAQTIDLTRPIAVYVWSQGNFFFADIAAYTVAFLHHLGARARLQADTTPPPPDAELLIVAPHEFCIHGPGRHWPAEALVRAVHLNTEQWHTSWFALARPFLARSARALDLNPASAAGLARHGITAGFLPLLPLPGTVFAPPRAPLSPAFTARRHTPPLIWPERHADRPIAVAFLGTANPRRGAALAALAPVLARHRCFIHAPSFAGPIRPDDADSVTAADFAQIARNAKVLLNIHQGESRYFEWHRIVAAGIMEACVVVSEPSLATGIVHAGQHLIETPLARMAETLAHLLETPEGAARLARIHTAAAALRTRVLAAAQTPAGLAALCTPAGW